MDVRFENTIREMAQSQPAVALGSLSENNIRTYIITLNYHRP